MSASSHSQGHQTILESMHAFQFDQPPPLDDSTYEDSQPIDDLPRTVVGQKPVTNWFPPNRRPSSSVPPRKGDVPPSKMKKDESKEEAEATLIDQVRSHQCLWYEYSPDRKDRDLVQAAWNTVHCHCDKTVFATPNDAKIRFKNLRDYFFNLHKNNKQPSGSGASKKVTWCHYDSLTFLLSAKSKDYRTQNRLEIIVFVIIFINKPLFFSFQPPSLPITNRAASAQSDNTDSNDSEQQPKVNRRRKADNDIQSLVSIAANLTANMVSRENAVPNPPTRNRPFVEFLLCEMDNRSAEEQVELRKNIMNLLF